MTKARVTVVQFERDSAEPRRNLDRMKEDVRAHAESDLVVFPELVVHGHEWATEMPDARTLRPVSEAMLRELDEVAAECRTSVVYGSLVERDGKLYNLATFTDGRERVSYAKTHVHWSEAFEPGREFPVAKGFVRPLGMLICFDAAFPEVPRLLALGGAEIIVNISAIPAEFPLKHVHRRLVACSTENQVFTVFANRAGDGFLGGSAIVGPEGDVLALAGGRGSLTIDIDFDEVRRWREQEPLFVHRRPSLYERIAR
ncbi:MAG TPA: carbon-nitrogen hydrolase family protein [Candidatus Thermoplasmatota archaeon]|nr:carbon-nitrogen hydrolase family protein [Candidatus Thermoplasmatota archaeon]